MPSSTSCSGIRIPRTDRNRSCPPLLAGVVVFAFLLFLTSRGLLPVQDSPAFSLPPSSGLRVLLGDGFPNPGVHQFSDGSTISSVIGLTGVAAAVSGPRSGGGGDPDLVDGMALTLVKTDGDGWVVEQNWMPARQRLALGILLHPDRMSRDDWVTLPGIGEKMAERIEDDRQIYGDFGGFDALERVKGIGPAMLKKLRPFFVDEGK